MTDYRLLQDADWLTDTLISAAKTLLKKSNPLVSGLQVTTKGEVLSFDMNCPNFKHQPSALDSYLSN